MARKKDRCVIAGCDNEPGVGTRGCCPGCYRTLLREVNAGTATWDKYVALGWALPDNRGRPRSTAASRLLEKSKS